MHDPRRPPNALRRRCLLAAALSPALVLPACGGGGGGDGGEDGGDGAPPSGRIVMLRRDDDTLAVIDVATGRVTSMPAPPANWYIGVGASRNGYLATLTDDGGDAFRIDIRTLALASVAAYTIDARLVNANGAVVLNADATRMAYSINEIINAAGDRGDRTYVNDLGTGALLARIDDAEEPAFVDTGELLLRRGERLHVYDSQLRDQGALPITVSATAGAFSASPDGRYVAHETGSRISMLDRNSGLSWFVTSLQPRGSYGPVFSPDGQWLALFYEGSVAGRYLHIIRFRPGVTVAIDDSGVFEAEGGDTVWGVSRYGWSR